MGAWIETQVFSPNKWDILVAPHVGAWIETSPIAQSAQYRAASHPMWVRGLKHIDPQKAAEIQAVAPHVGAWIETLSLAARY